MAVIQDKAPYGLSDREALYDRRVIRTVTFTLNPRRVSMGLSGLPSPVLSSTHACDWSWWCFTSESEFSLYTQPSITAFVVLGNCYDSDKWPTSCNTELLSMIRV